MKRSIRSLCAVAGLVTVLATPSLFATDSIEEVIQTMHEAEKSSEPLPLLQKAMDEYEHYNPRTGLGHWRANNAATVHHKIAAKAKLQEAIDDATAGKNPGEKIDAAIAEMRLSAEFKH